MLNPSENQIAPRYRRQIMTLARTIDNFFNATAREEGHVGFCLMVLSPPNSDDQRWSYVTNIDPETLTKELDMLRQRVTQLQNFNDTDHDAA